MKMTVASPERVAIDSLIVCGIILKNKTMIL